MADETLKITGGNAAGQTITLEQELVIGRSTPGLGSLGGDSEISRVHARVFHDPSGRLTVEDLGSTNGTFVNGNRISGQQPLNPGDEVRVGQTTLSVEGGAGAGATTVGNVVPAPVPVPPPQQPPTQQLPPTGQQPAAPPPPQPVGQGPGAPPPPGGPGFGGGPVGGPPQRSDGGRNKNLLYALGALLLIALIVAGLAIGGVFGGDDEGSETTAQTTPTTTATTETETTPTVAMPEPPPEPEPEEPSSGSDGYPPGFRKQFVDSCAQGGAPREICGCTFDRLQDQYTFPEFVELLGKADGGNLPPPVRNAVQQCAAG
jgi:pSer/pThr/pTyr-binding forkhead associated (FHA) protein